MQTAISVSTLNTQIKSLLESTFMGVYVEGEISNLTYHSSGHIYFSIIDDSSSISCVMFSGNAKHLKFKLENSLKILVNGNISAYVPRGSYQILCSKISLVGAGGLALAYEQLKKELKELGYFDESKKKQLPKYPNKIGIVTSSTGAAIQDMKKILANRYPMCEMVLVDTLVQGDNASDDIANSIKFLDTQKCDIIIAGRGGGSIEDLWAFNTKEVAMAFFNANTPILSAVGHESDFLISDLVADVRASTPSNAIEIATPDINELKMMVQEYSCNFDNKFKYILINKSNELKNLYDRIQYFNVSKKIQLAKEQTNVLIKQFNDYFLMIIEQKQNMLKYANSLLTPSFNNFILNKSNNLTHLQELLKIANPKNKIKDGYAQITKQNKITKLDNLIVGDNASLLSNSKKVDIKVTKISLI
jgi:exodeoxyribonuclease VII large subunit